MVEEEVPAVGPPGYTLPMSYEIEIKVPVAGFQAVRRAIRSAGGEYLGTFLQTDRFFDAPDQRLRRGDRGLRIRSVRVLRGAGSSRPAGPLVTYKGPRRAGRRAKTRLEIQSPVEDADALARIFEACGLVAVLTVEKRRASYRVAPCLVELDELPVIGRFVEIEGPDEKAIDEVRERLRLAGETTAEPYIDLVDARCGGVDTCRQVTFRRCGACPRAGSPPGS